MIKLNQRFPRRSRRLLPACVAVLAAGCVLLAPAAMATPYVVKFVQQGNSVVATGGGSIDPTGLTYIGSGTSGGAAVAPSLGFLDTAPLSLVDVDFYTGFSGPTDFGSGGATYAHDGAGDPVGMIADPAPLGEQELFLPTGYTSGPLSDTATYDNTTLAGLGLTPGAHVWMWGAGTGDQTFTIDVVVPEPGELAIFGAGLALAGLLFGLRRRGLPAARRDSALG